MNKIVIQPINFIFIVLIDILASFQSNQNSKHFKKLKIK
jgi:hypothetical protein